MAPARRTVTGDEWRDATIERADLSGAVLRDVDLSRVQMRGVYLWHADIDGDVEGLRINGVEVGPLIDAELDRRHPERAGLRATDPAALQAGWALLEEMWAATLTRVAAMPPGTVDRSVDDEWPFAQTLRHLVMATDSWLRLGILGDPEPFHPLGIVFWEWGDRVAELGIDADAQPTYEEVLAARSDRVAQVRDYLARATASDLAETNPGPPWAGEVTALDAIHVIMNEEWQHHRFAIRDLDRIDQLDAG